MGFGSQNQFGGVPLPTDVTDVLATSITNGDTTHAPDGNAVFDALYNNFETTATAAGTTTLTAASKVNQLFTGTTTQTVVLPVTSTLTLGRQFFIINNSTGVVTVNSSGGNLVQTLIAGENTLLTCILTSGTTAASWDTVAHLPVTSANTLQAGGLAAINGQNFMIDAPSGAILYFRDPSTQTVGYMLDRRLVLESLEYLSTTPAQITADQNNYSILTSTSVWLRWSSDASRNVTGAVMNVAGNKNGDYHRIINVGAFDIVLKHEDALSTAANRFLCSTGADITLTPNQGAEILYDTATARWRVFKLN